jgi:enoyl-CoA hydratase/carnithine racemase
MIKQPGSAQEALAHALALAITAPDDERAESALEIADELAASLSPNDVERAKLAALVLVREAQEEATKSAAMH